jgi:TRAP-type C4-dicarboxylate transport system permease small subunit
VTGIADPSASDRFGRALERVSRTLALAGGAILVALAGMSVGSIVGRSLGHPIQGDFELVQFGCAIAISFFLPYCQLRRANIIVDFFTVAASERTRGFLDALGAALLGCVMALLAWRVGVGALELRATQETSMLLGVPLWYAYALIAPAFGLTALAAFYTSFANPSVVDPSFVDLSFVDLSVVDRKAQ